MNIDGVISYHESDLCGVTRFGRHLATKLGVPHGGFALARQFNHLLFNIKPHELFYDERVELEHIFRRLDRFSLFLHGNDTDFKGRYRGAEHVFTANQTIPGGTPLWWPGTLNYVPMQFMGCLTVFSMGMAHKFHRQRHEQLKRLLDATGKDYRVVVSTAFHEGSDFAVDGETVGQHIMDVYEDRGVFVGFLSDQASAFVMSVSAFFAAFFAVGVRPNNTTVMAAMSMGCPVITNLDDHSPDDFIHNDTILDIDKIVELDKLKGVSIGRNAKRLSHDRYSWDRLTECITSVCHSAS